MKFLAFTVVVAGLSLGCADIPNTNDPPIRAAAPTNNLPPTTPGVEAPKIGISPTASMSTSPGMIVSNDRDPPERIPVSR